MFSPFQPFLYLVAYLAMLYIRPHEYVPALAGVPILPALLVIAFAFWLARQPKSFEASQHRLMPVLMLLMAWSVLLSGWVGGAVVALTDFAPVVLLFYMVSTSIDNLAKLRVLFLLLTIASCVMALHGIDQVGDELGTGWTGAVMIEGRITYLGFLNDPNDLAMSMLMTLPMCLHLAQRSRSFLLRWCFRAAAFLILYGVYLTNSRGAILGIGAMLFVYSTRRYGVWRSVVIVPLMAAPMILLAPSRIGEISADEDSAAGRVEAWYEGFQMIRAHPLFGVGKDQFTDHHHLTAHNSYVLTASELGLVGYFVWLSNIILTVLMLLAMIRAVAPKAVAGPVVGPEDSPPGTGASDPETFGSITTSSPTRASSADGASAAPGSADDTGASGSDSWSDCQTAARTLFYGMVAALVCSFFLSRSYVVILYLQIALVVAVYQLMRAKWPSIPLVLFGPIWGKLLTGSLASVFFLWIVTRVLL